LINNTLDKLVFGALLILLFQVPILSDHYLQFISGYYQATQQQVTNYEKNATLHGYENVYAMVDDFLKNETPAVRKDGEQKLQTLNEYEALKEALVIMQNGNIFQRSWYMFNPLRWKILRNVLENFSPGIPLKLDDILYGILLALLLSYLFMWPIKHIFEPKNLSYKKS
jgi:hypothetical protein